MVTHRALVTGGLGFIGSHICKELLGLGHDVSILDNSDPQVHRGGAAVPQGAELMPGDVRDPEAWRGALKDVDVVFHEAAAVGIGQSMYQVSRFVDVNSMGTAMLLEHLANEEHDIRKLIVASSNTVYGEGSYRCSNCGEVFPGLRAEEDLKRGMWEPRCPACGEALEPTATREDKPLMPTSIYAITKRDQEEMSLTIGRAYGIPTVALRYFCVYGPGQTLSNPYTGVTAIFYSRIVNGKTPIIYEDGRQTRDFLYVGDAVKANMLALGSNSMNYGRFNVGTGVPISITDVANGISGALGVEVEPEITGRYRAGDIRHCYADIGKIEKCGFSPDVTFQEGISTFTTWADNQATDDGFDEANRELENRGLLSRR